MLLKFIPFIIFSVLLSAVAQLSIRKGMVVVGTIPEKLSEIWGYFWQAYINPWIFARLTAYAISMLFWMYVLSKVNVSLAYPFQSLAYLVIAFAAYYTLNEPLSIQKILSIIIICVGVFILTLSPDA